MMRTTITLALLALLSLSALGQDRPAAWVSMRPEDVTPSGTVVYHKSFDLDFDVTDAYLKFTCFTPMDFGGTHYRAYVNDIEGAAGSYWEDAQVIRLSKVLRKGQNEIEIEVTWVPMGPPGPVLAKLVARGKDKDGKAKSITVRSDETWLCASGKRDAGRKWDQDAGAKPVAVAGPADQWEHGKNPQVLPKIDTSTVVGVTDVRMKGGNAGSIFQFNLVRDYSDKFYFLKALGYHSVEDNIFGQSNYQEPGKWFWDYDKEIARNQERAGFEFTVYPWIWVPPDWYRKQEKPRMVKCIEHNQEGFGLSLWSPLLIKFNEDIYAELKREFGESIRFIYPGIYGDFGEAHYMAGWNFWLSPKPDHVHADFWAGDVLAREDFRKKMMSKYGSIDKLNAAWKSSFKSADVIVYPKLDGTDPRRYTLDFVNWYYDCMTDFTAKVCSIAKRQFPGVPIAPKLGCGDENPLLGQDNSAIPEALAKIGVGVRSTHGSSPNFAVRRISSACKFYGNQFETETAGGTNRHDAAKKFFIDASCGCAEIFEYPNAILQVADIFSRCRRNLRGEHSITDIALFFPTSWHRLQLRQGYPPKLVEAAEELRDLTDFDIVDENMLLDGALDKYRVLVMFDGNLTEQSVYDRISKWVEAGGTLVLRAEQLPFTNIEGDALPVSKLADRAKSGDVTEPLGTGKLVVWSGAWDKRQDYYGLIFQSAPSGRIDGKADGIWASLSKNHVLYLNNTDAPVRVSESISEDFARKAGVDFQPRLLKYAMEVPAHSQAVHFFNRPFVELAVECEEMDGASKLPSEMVTRGGWSEPGRAVRLGGNSFVRASVTLPEDADYSFCCVADPGEGSRAWIEIDGKKAADVTGPSGVHKFMYPVLAPHRLGAGPHSITLRCEKGEVLADKIVVTTDTQLVGFAYGFVDPAVDQGW